jgi:outer membrane lipoprotein-sorting protein
MIFVRIPANGQESGVLSTKNVVVKEGGHPMSKAVLRWTPAVVAIVVVAGVAVAVPAAANASVSLPTKTPAQVLELVASSKVTALSGTVDETSDLGLPSLPTGASGSSGASSGTAADLALLTGNNSLRVYVDGPGKVRVQDLESLAERDVIRNGNDVWVYDSQKNAVSHGTLGTADHRPALHGAPTTTTDPAELTPDGLATKLLADLKPSSDVSVAPDAVRVAGRAAYDLILTPRVTDTLLGSIHIAVDAQTGLPLRVQVDARGQATPAVSIGFTSLDLSTPAASLFNFTPPAGAKVTELKRPDTNRSDTKPKAPHSDAAKPANSVTGTGWDAVVSVSAHGALADLAKSSEFAELTTAVPGGRVLHTSLVNVLFTSDGRIVAGSVSVARLQAVASAP